LAQYSVPTLLRDVANGYDIVPTLQRFVANGYDIVPTLQRFVALNIVVADPPV